MLRDLGWLKQIKIIDENGAFFSDNNPFPVHVIDFKKICWITDTDFAPGSLIDTEIKETGEDAYIQLEDFGNNNDAIAYSDAANYTFSDGAKITVDENDSNKAELKILGGANKNYPFITPSEYTYDPIFIEVDAGSRLTPPENVTSYALYDEDINLGFGGGVLTGTSNGGAGITNNRLDLTGGSKNVTYSGVNNVDMRYTGAVRGVFTPNWTGIPASNVTLFAISDSFGFLGNYITVYIQGGTGKISFQMRDKDSVIIVNKKLDVLDIVAGVSIEIEFNFDLTTGEHRVFIDGVLSGTVDTTTSSDRDQDGLKITIGSAPALSNFFDGYIEDLIFYSEVQHTSNYTPGLVLYAKTNPTIETVNGFVFATTIDTFTETATKPGSDEIKYQISSDDGVTFKWWNGSVWVAITGGQTDTWYYNNESNLASVVNTNIGSLAGSGTLKINSFLHSDDGTTTPELENIYVATPITYSITDDLYIDTKDVSQIAPATIVSWLTAIITNSKPANTDARILFSTDNRVSWLAWSGSQWEAPASATTRTDATSLADAVINFGSLALGDGTLDVRLFLYTSDSTVTPEVSNINAISDAGFAPSGSYESELYDSTYFSLDWGIISFSLDLPIGTTITIKAKASNDSGDLGSYGSALSSGAESNVSGRYIQWIAEFTTSNTESSKLESLGINFTVPSRLEVRP